MHIKELFDLTGQTALITGGSRGLGKEIAMGLGEAGASVVITARREKWLEPTRLEFIENKIECLALPCDVSQPDQVDATVRKAIERFGKIDILVNNAGITWASPPQTFPLDKWNEIFAINVTGAFLMSRAVFESMTQQGKGKIINVASVAGIIGSSSKGMDAVAYSASKGALISLTRDLAVKWAPLNITVNALAPGFFPTRMTEGFLEHKLDEVLPLIPMGRIGKDGELKGAALFLASKASDYLTGQVLVVDGGSTAC